MAPGIQHTVRWRGIDWDPRIPMHQRHLLLWQRHREAPYAGTAEFLNPISEHFLEACRLLFTRQQLVIHPWFEAIADAFTMNRVVILMGPASSSKSHSAGILLLMDYLTDPQNTFACMVSTTKDMLLLRSFASTIEYLHYLKANRKFSVPFKYVAQKTAIVPEDTAESRIDSVKAMIKGIAISEGSSADAKASIMGVHLPRVRSCADEFENMGSRAQAFLDAQDNLSVCRDYKMVVMFNPQSIYAPGCMLATPKDGWASVDLDSTSWVTARGDRVLRFDAHKSPGRDKPLEYPFLPTNDTIAEILKRNNNNEDSPGYWTFVRAFPPPQTLSRTVLTEAMLRTYDMMSTVVWRDKLARLAALDPSFTEAGDDCPLVFATVGTTKEGVVVLHYDRVVKLLIKASDPKPVTEQIADQVAALLAEEGVPIEHFACDDSGTQNVSDVIAMRMGNTLYRCNFLTRPPKLPVSVVNPALADTRYKNMVTWMYFCVAEYAQHGQIKGFPVEAAEQLCGRRVAPGGALLQLEAKAEYKKRNKQRSPDVGDACAMIAGLCRDRIGLAPGTTDFNPAGFQVQAVQDPNLMERIQAINNVENFGQNYLTNV